MRTSVIALVASVSIAQAHDHLEIGVSPSNPSALAFAPGVPQVATYFPLGEQPSNYLPHFPGGYFACELTLTVEGDSLDLPSPALVRAEVLAVVGPAGGNFAFWESGASAPTFSRPSGWSASGGNQPSFPVSEDATGYGHIHGRVFTFDKPGSYTVTFRAVDSLGGFSSSAPREIQFEVVEPPQLSIERVGNNIRLQFTGRDGLSYDVQSSSSLAADDWVTIGDPLEGDGGILQFTDPIGGRSRVFYRLVEYQ